VNQLGAAAATYAITDSAHIKQEQQLNRTARAYSVKALTDLGYKVADSQANFLMMDLRRNAQPFRDACAKRNVLVGRPFPPLDTYVRISIGTPAEMKQAVDVFREVLSAV
jgi:histidinol-phosphate aminotransferase